MTPAPLRLAAAIAPKPPASRARSRRAGLRAVAALVALSLPAGGAAAGPVAAPPRSTAKIEPTLAARALAHPADPVVVWVRFSDRAGADRDPGAYAAARRALSARSLARRAARGSLTDLDATDLPVHEPYVHALVVRGARLRGVSRWLNAASIEVPGTLLGDLARLPFVARIERVPVGWRVRPVGEPEEVPTGVAPARPGEGDRAAVSPTAPATAPAPGDTAYYGGTFRQLQMMQVPALHAQGLSGAGVLVCMLDSGFHLTHKVFANLDVVAKRDFIHGDTTVDNEAGQDTVGQNTHGTWTLSCVAGSKPGTFSGVAFGASVALGKTEWVPTETPVEMDYWQFGAEWADSLGADVISSSLGYSEFDDTTSSYTYADMNGRTTVVTLAAVEAARRGITVVTAAGNEGGTTWHYIIAPGDADSVITSGAVDSFNVVTGFSSRGPTSDGRTKPDVTAMGSKVLCPSTSNDSAYVRVSGTSFSTPLTAGLVALLLQAHPTWGPWQVREALRETALNNASPNNDIGWGLVQGLAARNWTPPAGVGPGSVATELSLAAGPNPMRAGAATTIWFSIPGTAWADVEVLDLSGRRLTRLYSGEAKGPKSVVWDGRDARHQRLAAGVYWIRLAVRGSRPGTTSSRAIRVALLP